MVFMRHKQFKNVFYRSLLEKAWMELALPLDFAIVTSIDDSLRMLQEQIRNLKYGSIQIDQT